MLQIGILRSREYAELFRRTQRNHKSAYKREAGQPVRERAVMTKAEVRVMGPQDKGRGSL